MPAPRRSGAAWRTIYAVLCAASALVLLGTRVVAIEIFSHFQVYAAVAWLAALACYAASARVRASFWRPRRALTAALALLAAHGALIGWLWLPTRAPALDREPAVLEVVCFNMRHDEAALADVARRLASHPPDLWVLTETTAGLTLPGYEHVFHDAPDAIGIWSRHPLEDLRALPVAGDRDQLTATVVIGRYRLPLLAVHWRIPIRGGHGHAAATSARLAAEHPHLLMLGDLNSTPWSPRMRLLAEGGLRRADQLGIAGTWAADPWHLLTLPIDHLLVKGDVRVESLTRLPWTTSDHRPLLARIACAHRR